MENAENKTENKNILGNGRNKIIALALVLVLAASAVAGVVYWSITSARVYVENATISAPVVTLSTKAGGVLQQIFAKEGDMVQDNAPVARIGNELIKSQNAGTVLTINSDIGANFAPGQPVATMIDQNQLRVVGQVQEDKGLKDIAVGQKAIFTVDAFGSKEYTGIVDQINPSANQGDIVFNISNARQENDFDIKVRFNIGQYPELKNGMSAKVWIYK
jgi:multidrug resistance efflux pump